jgi:tryptophanyl-tRNA synthetase
MKTTLLSDGAETVRRKVMSMYTDLTARRATDPATSKATRVVYHDAFNPHR